MGKIFSCEGCTDKGLCCRDFGQGKISEDIVNAHEDIQGKGPIYSVIPMGQKRIALYGWEVERLKAASDTRFELKPRTVIYDLKGDVPLVLSWNLNHDDCPFLDDGNSCTVYEDRMMHCRIFPLSRSGPGGVTKTMFSSLCPNIVATEGNGNIKDLYEAYGDIFLWAVQRDIVIGWLKHTVNEAVRKGMIRPATNRPLDWINRKLKNKKPRDAVSHLKSLGVPTQQQIDRFYTLEDARRLVESQME